MKNSDLDERVYYSDNVIALQSPIVNNVTYRFQVDSRNGGVILYKSEDNGVSWVRNKEILSNADLDPRESSDLNTISAGFSFLLYGKNTLNSPYKQGLSGALTAGGVISFNYGAFGNQVAMPAGKIGSNSIFVRTKDNSVWSNWVAK